MAEIDYTKYSQISGTDVQIIIDGIVVGEAAGITVSATRRKLPVYTFGTVDPRGYGRGVRSVSGVLDYVSLNGQLIDKILKQKGFNIYVPETRADYASIVGLRGSGTKVNITGAEQAQFEQVPVWYADELPPLDWLIVGMNEYGKKAMMKLFGVEFLNSDWAISLDDVSSAERLVFVARTYQPWVLIDESTNTGGTAGGVIV